MQLQICCVLLSVMSVLAQYSRHQWVNSYGPSRTPYILHNIPVIEEFQRGWMGFYEYRPIFDGKSEYPATSPELVELNPEKTSAEVSEDVAEPEVPNLKGPSDPSEPTEIHWNPWESAFDYPSNEKRPTDFFHSNNGQSSEVPDRVKFATQDPFYKWWNSAEEFSFFSDVDDTPGLSESSAEAVADPKPSISPVPSTTPEPIYKFSGQSVSDGPKTVYKHNYRKVTTDKNKRLHAQTA